ncbi:MAG: hypothetical protein ACTSQ8_27105 [Candidatus Helarchaeota archaeon]
MIFMMDKITESQLAECFATSPTQIGLRRLCMGRLYEIPNPDFNEDGKNDGTNRF